MRWYLNKAHFQLSQSTQIASSVFDAQVQLTQHLVDAQASLLSGLVASLGITKWDSLEFSTSKQTTDHHSLRATQDLERLI